MTNKITLLLSMSLNVVLALVILENNKKPVALADFRDAISDNRASLRLADVASAEVPSAPAVETAPAAAAVEAPAPAPEQAPAKALIVANDWAAYKQDMAEDKDVVVSNIFKSEKNGKRAMLAAVSRLQAAGNEVLFSCMLPATGGGTFYLIRILPAAPEIPRMASLADVASKDYIKEAQYITDRTEKEVWGSI
ncbi:MAG: hypothetical protein HY952_05725 [Elusimicrobia bacterium]|nr:hypothetical protein [Elusimicrobiota bacterium]